MNILLSDDAVMQEIRACPDPNWIWVDIWEISQYEIKVVVTVSKRKCLGTHKLIYICSSRTDKDGEVDELKKYGRRITRLLRRKFSDSEVHSDLRCQKRWDGSFA